MAGFPVEDRERFRDWTYRINSFFFQSGTADPVAAEDANAAVVEARTWIHGLLEERRAHPKDDLLTALVAAEYEGGRLTEAELLSTAITLFLGGHDTTTQLIALGMSALVRHPDQLELLRERPDLVPGGGRGDAPLRRAVPDEPPLRDGGRRARRPDAPGRRPRPPGAWLRQPRPGPLRGSGRLPDRAAAGPSSELRAGPSLLPGRATCAAAGPGRRGGAGRSATGSAPRPRTRTNDRTSGPTSRAAASGRSTWPSTRSDPGGDRLSPAP